MIKVDKLCVAMTHGYHYKRVLSRVPDESIVRSHSSKMESDETSDCDALIIDLQVNVPSS